MNDFAADDLGYRSDGAGRSELTSYIRGEVHEAKEDGTREHGNQKREETARENMGLAKQRQGAGLAQESMFVEPKDIVGREMLESGEAMDEEQDLGDSQHHSREHETLALHALEMCGRAS